MVHWLLLTVTWRPSVTLRDAELAIAALVKVESPVTSRMLTFRFERESPQKRCRLLKLASPLTSTEAELPIAAAVAVVAGFAVCHGYAHGRELPLAAAPMAYSVGFVLATGLLHLLGIGMSWRIDMTRSSGLLYRLIGGGLALSGWYFVSQAVLA